MLLKIENKKIGMHEMTPNELEQLAVKVPYTH